MQFSVFQPSSRAQGFEIQKNETATCATDRPLCYWTESVLMYIERIAAENKYLESENKQIIPSLIDFMTDRFYIVILFTKWIHGADFAFQTRSQSVFTE